MEDYLEEVKSFLSYVLAEEDELFDLVAKLAKKCLDALIENGFSREEALRIVISQTNIRPERKS